MTQLNTKLKNQQKARIRGGNRTSIQKFGPLTGEDAALLIKERQEKEEVEVERKKNKKIKSVRRKIRKALYDQGVTARKQERDRKKEVAELTRTAQFIPIKLLKPIPDPEKLTTEEEIELQVQEPLILIPGFNGYDMDEERPQFVTGRVENSDLKGLKTQKK